VELKQRCRKRCFAHRAVHAHWPEVEDSGGSQMGGIFARWGIHQRPTWPLIEIGSVTVGVRGGRIQRIGSPPRRNDNDHLSAGSPTECRRKKGLGASHHQAEPCKERLGGHKDGCPVGETEGSKNLGWNLGGRRVDAKGRV